MRRKVRAYSRKRFAFLTRPRLESLEARHPLAVEVLNPSAGSFFRVVEFELLENSPQVYLNALDEAFPPPRPLGLGSAGGQVGLSPDSRYIAYQPRPGFSGTEQFEGQFGPVVKVHVLKSATDDTFTVRADETWHTLDLTTNDAWFQRHAEGRITTVQSSSDQADIEIAEDGKQVRFRFRSDRGPLDAAEFTYGFDGVRKGKVTITPETPLVGDSAQILDGESPAIVLPLVNDTFWEGYSGARRITHVRALNPSLQASVAIGPDGSSVHYTPPRLIREYVDRVEYVVDNQFTATIDVTIHVRTRPDQSLVKVNAERAYIDLAGNDNYQGPASNWNVLYGGRVTSVTASTHNATIAIADNGQGVYYTPPLDFSGQDKFEYETEHGLRQEVVVNVEYQIASTTVAGRRDGQSQTVDVLAGAYGDRPSNGSYRITMVAQPTSGGTAAIVNNQILYTPPTGDVTENQIYYTVDNLIQVGLFISGPSATMPDAEFTFCDPVSPSYSLDVFQKIAGLPQNSRIASAVIVDKQPDNGTIRVASDGRTLELTPNVLSDFTVRIVLENGEIYKLNVKWPKLPSDSFSLDAGPRTLDVVANDRAAWPCNGDDGTIFSYDGPWQVTSVQTDGVTPSPLIVQDGAVVYTGPAPRTDFPIPFRYVVDGRLVGSGLVTSARYASPDHAIVRPGATHRIPVLGNDAFSSYEDSKVTQISSSQIGATVEVIDDGTALLYRAPQLPANTTATDSLTYTVNGNYTASVEVQVKSESPQTTDSSYVELAESLLADVASGNLRYPFSSTTNGFSFTCACITQDGGYENPANFFVSPFAYPLRAARSLHVQVQGLIYAAVGEDLVILEDEGRDQLREIGRWKIGGAPLAIYQDGTRLTMLSGVQAYETSWNRGETSLDSIYNETRITVLDIENARQPRVIQSTQVEGRLRDSQFVDGKLRMALEQVKMPPLPKVITNPTDGKFYYEDMETYVARAQADWGTFLHDSMPNYVSYDGNGILVRSGMLHTLDELYRPLDEAARTPYSFVTVDPASNEPGVVAAIAGYATPFATVFLGDQHAYLLNPIVEGTRIQRVDWGDQATDPKIDATIALSEWVAGAGYLNEYEETLVAVVGPINGNGSLARNVLTLREDGGALKVVGRATSTAAISAGSINNGIRLNGSVLQVPGTNGMDYFELADATNPQPISQMPYIPFQGQTQWINDRYFLNVSSSTLEIWDAIDKNTPVQITSKGLARTSIEPPVIAYDADSGLVTLTHAIQYDVTAHQDPLTNQLVNKEAASVVAVYRLTLPSAGNDVAKVEFLRDYHVSGRAVATLVGDAMVTFTDRTAVKTQFLPGEVKSEQTSGLLQAPTRFDPWTVAELLAQANVGSRLQSVRAAMAASASPPTEVSRLFPVAVEWRRGALDVIVDQSGTSQHWREQSGQATQIAADFAFATATDYDAAFTWHNELEPLDVNGDGFISPIDALLIINRLNAQNATALAQGVAHHQIAVPRGDSDPLWDSSGDGYVSPFDAILVINELEAQSRRKKTN